MREKLAVILSRFPYPLDKGDRLRAFHQIRYLSQHMDIYLFALVNTPVHPDHLEALKPYCVKVITYPLSAWASWLRACRGLLSAYPIQTAFFYSGMVDRSIRSHIIRLQPDYVYCQLSRTARYGRALPFPKLIDFQDAFSLNYQREALQFSTWKRWFYRLESRRMFRFETMMQTWFDRCTIISAFDKSQLQLQPNEVRVVPNGVDTAYFISNTSVKPFDIVFCGNLGYAPNVRAVEFILDQLLPALRYHKPDISVRLAGARGERWFSRRGPNVQVDAWVEDIREVYQSGKVFVAPLFSGAGLQNKLLEAMSMSLPCVSTAYTQVSLQAVPGRDMLLAENLEEFVQHVLRLLEDSAFYDQIAKGGRKWVQEHYSWEMINQGLTALFRSMHKEVTEH